MIASKSLSPIVPSNLILSRILFSSFAARHVKQIKKQSKQTKLAVLVLGKTILNEKPKPLAGIIKKNISDISGSLSIYSIPLNSTLCDFSGISP